MTGSSYKRGDPWVICDRSGRKVRMSETVKEWTGLRVHRSEVDYRHPQEFVRGVRDRQVVHDARPEAADSFVDQGGFSIGFSAGFRIAGASPDL